MTGWWILLIGEKNVPHNMYFKYTSTMEYRDCSIYIQQVYTSKTDTDILTPKYNVLVGH